MPLAISLLAHAVAPRPSCSPEAQTHPGQALFSVHLARSTSKVDTSGRCQDTGSTHWLWCCRR